MKLKKIGAFMIGMALLPGITVFAAERGASAINKYTKVGQTGSHFQLDQRVHSIRVTETGGTVL